MTTTGPLPPALSGVPAPASNTRKAVRADGQNGGASSFDDFLSDKNGSDLARTKDADADVVAPSTLKGSQAPADYDDSTDAATLDPNARPPGPPMLPPITAMTAQQAAMTTMPSTEIIERKKQESALESSAANSAPIDPRTGLGQIRPHGPPASGGTVEPPAPSATPPGPSTARVPDTKPALPTIEPHGPPASLPESTQNAASTVVTSTSLSAAALAPDTVKTIPLRITPHGPPVQAANTQDITSASAGGPIEKVLPSPIEPHGPPDLPDDTVTAAAPTLPMTTKAAALIKQPALPPVEPHGPPDVPDDTVSGQSTKTGVAIKGSIPSPSEPHGPPEQVDDTVPPAVTPIIGQIKQPTFPVIEPHGPPDQPDNTVTPAATPTLSQSKKAALPTIKPHGPPATADGSASVPAITAASARKKLDYTTTIPAPVSPPAAPVQPTGTPPAGLAKGEYTTTIPNFPGDGTTLRPDSKATPIAGAAPDGGSGGSLGDGGLGTPTPVYSAQPPMEITSAMQARVPAATLLNTGAVATEGKELTPSDGDDVTVKSAPITALRPAILAAPLLVNTAKATGTANDISLQVPFRETVVNDQSNGGTPVAKEQAIVTAESPTTETIIDRSALLRRGAVVSAAPSTSVGDLKAAAAMPISVASPTAVTDAPATTTAATSPQPMASAEHVQKMLQTVLDAGIKTAASGSNHLEMRVRLDGGANDVTVRLRMQDNAMHVTFQTGSPELRQALERGWSDFTASAAQNAAVTVEPPRFVAEQSAQAQNTTDFSGGSKIPPARMPRAPPRMPGPRQAPPGVRAALSAPPFHSRRPPQAPPPRAGPAGHNPFLPLFHPKLKILMTVTGSSSPAVGYSTASTVGQTDTLPQQQLGQNDFLQLLATQLSAQDPTKPMDDTQFISQMANFSSLQQMQTLNTSFNGFAGSQAAVSAPEYLGKQVTATDPNTGNPVTGVPSSVNTYGGSVTLTIDGQDFPLSSVTSVSSVPSTGSTVASTAAAAASAAVSTLLNH